MKSKLLVIFNLVNAMVFISFQQGCAALNIRSDEPQKLLTFKDLQREKAKAQAEDASPTLDFQIALPEAAGDVEYQMHNRPAFQGALDEEETVMLVAVTRKNGKDLAVNIYQPSDLLTICLDCKHSR